MASSVINISVSATGVRTVTVDFQGLGNAARGAQAGVDSLKGALASIGGLLAVDKLQKWSDAWASANGQIRVNSQNQTEATAVTNRLYDAAQRTRQGFTDVVALYNRMATSTKDLGVSQNQMIQLTQNVGEALAYSHVSAGQASGALLQLSQALGSGIVRAQEFNSVLQGAPAILQVAANHIDAAGGSVTKLRQLMLAQKLTSKELFDAILAGGGEIDDKFNKSSAMISQAFTVMNNSMIRVIGTMNEQLGVGNQLTHLAQTINANLDQVAAGLEAVGVAAAVAFSPALVRSFGAAVATLWEAAMANPWVAIATTLAGVVVYLTQMRDSINLGIDKTTTLGDLFRAIGADVQSMWSTVQDVFQQFSTVVTTLAQHFDEQFGTSISKVEGLFTDFYVGVGSGFQGVVLAIARNWDVALGGATYFVKVIEGIPRIFMSAFSQVYNTVDSYMTSAVNVAIRGINTLRSVVGGQQIDLVKAQPRQTENISDVYADAITAGRAAYDRHTFENGARGLFAQAQNISSQRTSNAGTSSTADLDKHGAAVDAVTAKTKKAHDTTEQFKNQLRSLESQLQPSSGATLQIAHDTDIFNQALARGMISTQEYAKWMDVLDLHYQDIQSPLGKINRDINDQTNLLGLNYNQRGTYTSLLEYENQLRSEGIILSGTEKVDLVSKIDYYRRLNDVMSQYDAITNAQNTRTGQAIISAATQAQQDGSISGNIADAYRMQGAVQVANSNVASGQGQFSDYVAATVGQATSGYKGLAAGLTDSFGSFFQSFEEGFANSIGKAITGTESFGAALKEVATTGISQLIAGLVKLAEQYVITQALQAMLPKSLFNGLLGSSTGSLAGLTGHANGGYTGDIGRHQIAGTVHGGEYVFDADATRNLGRDTLDNLSKGILPSSAGGVTTNSNVVSVGGITIQGANIQDGKVDDKTMGNLGKQIDALVQTAMSKHIADQQRVGGILYGRGS